MEQFFQWFFDGLGTFLVGLVLGGSAGWVTTYRIVTKKVKQKANAKDHSTVIQVGDKLETK
ncbi:MAG: hypothetical protein LBR76_03470 [Oscillospiraceae bacterium]|jgi:hypothetical protein|nr:hypothetical protein [Oscillospiraceae bacterium]